MQSSTTTLPRSLEKLADLLDAQAALTPAKAYELVLNAQVQAEDLMPYADFEHPVQDCYGRKMVVDGGSFEIMVMSWNPGDFSAIHNHGYTEWGVVQAFGMAQNNLFSFRQGMLSLTKKEILQAGAAIKVNNALIHQMGNPTSQRYLSLHVYGCNERDHAVTADASIYELEKERIVQTTGGAFFNLPPEEVMETNEPLKTTQETFMGYAVQLLAYYNRQEETPRIRELKKRLFQQMERWSLN